MEPNVFRCRADILETTTLKDTGSNSKYKQKMYFPPVFSSFLFFFFSFFFFFFFFETELK